MSKEVKRFVVDMQGRGEECVFASDYEALVAERDALRSALERFYGGRLFFAGYKQVVKDGVVYISTSAKPSETMTKILGSEFDAANA